MNRADRYGLAQLYQLRGRVGRSDRRAYAYLLVPPDTVLSEIARKRLAAIREFSELGAGFRIAALDLELRGAGNLLGGEQSGHIEAVGPRPLPEAAGADHPGAEGRAPRASRRAPTLNLGVDLRIPEDYVPEVHQRMRSTSASARSRTPTEMQRCGEEIRDRYGPPAAGGGDAAALRGAAAAGGGPGRAAGRPGGRRLHLRFAPDPPLAPEALVRTGAPLPGASLSPQGVLRVALPAGRGARSLALVRALSGPREGARSRA